MAGGGQQVDYVRKGIIVLLLLGFVVFSHQYVVYEGDHDPRGLFALGFVILASYIIGELVELIKLPHITGYLLGGLFLGPSLGDTFSKLYPDVSLIPPFDHGVLNTDIIQQLGLLDTLALPLICLTAGGALKPKEIWKSKFPISGLLIGQVLAMFLGVIGLFYLMSGPVPFLTLPQLSELSLPAILAIGAVAASISIATSDAATIAIVVSAKAKGPMTTNIISVAVLKDVVVVIAFSAATAIATATLGVSSGGTLQDALIAIAISCVGGVILGGGIHLYLKLVGQELVLFLVGLIYTVSFISDSLHLESALMFIVAGFVIANWSAHGDRLIKEVERVSTPVFVVFFTLAGAKLHLDVLASIIVLALALAVVRTVALFVGCKMGGMLAGADQASQKYAWMGFVSQAGLAITLANTFPGTYGTELGGALFSVILGGVAIHELIGPAMLQAALGLAKELPVEKVDAGDQTTQTGIVQSSIDWGTSTPTSSDKLNQQANALTDDLTDWAEGVISSVVKPRVQQLRHINKSNRIAVCLGLGKSTALDRWNTERCIEELDLIIDKLSDGIVAEIEPESYLPTTDDGALKRALKTFGRARFRLLKPKRLVDVRALGRYYFSGIGPEALVSVAEEILAFERNASKNIELLDLNQITETDYKSFLDQAEPQISNRLYLTLQRLYRDFSQDLKNYGTISCPAVARRFRLVFDARNNGIMTLVEEKQHWQDLATARWNATALNLIRTLTVNRILKHINSKVSHVGPAINQIVEQITNLHASLVGSPADDWPEWCLSQKYNAAQIHELLELLEAPESWFNLSADLLLGSQAYPDALAINTESNKILWSQIGTLKTWTVFPNAVLSETIQQSNDNASKLSGNANQTQSTLLNLMNEIASTLEFYSKQTEPDLDALARLGTRLLELSSRFEDECVGLMDKIESTTRERLKTIEELWFQPVSTSQTEVVRSIREAVESSTTHLRQSIFKLLSNKQNSISAPDSYSRLFTANKRENIMTTERVAMRNDIQNCINNRQSVVLCGESFETTHFLKNLFRNSKHHTFFKNPDALVSKEELHQWIEAAKDGILIIANAELALSFYGAERTNTEFLREWAESYNCTLIIAFPKLVWAELHRTTNLKYSLHNVFELPSLSQEDLHKLLLSRHLISGYALEFSQRRNMLTRLMEELRLLPPVESAWMNKLMELSHGNRLEASRCWLNSITVIDEKKAILRLCSSPRQMDLNLTSDELVLCRQILRFGWINPVLTGRTFDFSEAVAVNWLDSLVSKELLEKHGKAYQVNELVEFSVRRQLQNNGWLT